jgi:exo-beta-1,3-glucanase (GH17 family)
MVNIEINKSHSDDASKAASGGERIQAVEDGIIMDGIVYSPYNNDRTCKRYRTVRDDLSLIKSKNVRSVRVYASDCNSLYTVLPAAKQLGLKVNQGLWVTSNINLVDSQVDDIIEAGNKYGWDLFTMFIVGNEVVLMNQVSAPALAAKMNEIRGRLRAAGFNGPITTAEPPSSFLQHPELCDAMDIVAVNAHPYFNAGCSADTSGSFVQGQADVSKQACPNKEVYIAETGFPSQGAPNGGNFPSVENQRTAINDIMIALDGKATFLSTFDDYWKDPGPNNIEQHFGIIEML